MAWQTRETVDLDRAASGPKGVGQGGFDVAHRQAPLRRVWQRISVRTGLPARDAWTRPPVSQAAQMNLNGWGPADPTSELDGCSRSSPPGLVSGVLSPAPPGFEPRIC